MYKYDWRSDPKILDERAVPNNGQALLEAKGLLQNLGLLADDLANGKSKITYLAGGTGEMVPTVSLSEANFVRVDMFRQIKTGLKGGNAEGRRITGERNSVRSQ